MRRSECASHHILAVFGESEFVERYESLVAVEDTYDDFFAVVRRKSRYAEVDLPVVDSRRETPVLRFATFVEPDGRENLDASRDGAVRRERKDDARMQFAIDTIAHTDARGHWLDMYIGRVTVNRVTKYGRDDLDGRGVFLDRLVMLPGNLQVERCRFLTLFLNSGFRLLCEVGDGAIHFAVKPVVHREYPVEISLRYLECLVRDAARTRDEIECVYRADILRVDHADLENAVDERERSYLVVFCRLFGYRTEHLIGNFVFPERSHRYLVYRCSGCICHSAQISGSKTRASDDAPDRPESGANGFSLPIGSGMIGVPKSLRLWNAISWKILPESVTARRASSVSTNSRSTVLSTGPPSSSTSSLVSGTGALPPPMPAHNARMSATMRPSARILCCKTHFISPILASRCAR